MSKRHKSRILALQALYQYEIAQHSVENLISFEWLSTAPKLNIDIINFASEIIYGTIKNINEIDDSIELSLENWKLSEISPIDKNILRMSIYSMLYQPEISASIIINEAINLAKEFGGDQSFSFINGVLDGFKNKSGCKLVK